MLRRLPEKFADQALIISWETEPSWVPVHVNQAGRLWAPDGSLAALAYQGRDGQRLTAGDVERALDAAKYSAIELLRRTEIRALKPEAGPAWLE